MEVSPISFKSYQPQKTKSQDRSAENKNSVSAPKTAACVLTGAAIVTLAVLAAKGKLKFKNKPKDGAAPKPKEDIKPPAEKITIADKQNKLSDTIKELFGKECKVSELSKEEQEKLAKTLIEREPDPEMKQELRRIFDQGLWDIL